MIYGSMLLLFLLLLGLLIYYTYHVYKLHGILQYHYISELACNKDPMEMETVRYNMQKEIGQDNFKKVVMGITISIIVLSFILMLISALSSTNNQLSGFIYLIVISFAILFIYIGNDYKKNKDIDEYIIKKDLLIKKLKEYFTINNIKTLDDLPSPIMKALMQRYKVLYDLRNSLGQKGYTMPLYSDIELLDALQKELVIEKIDKTTEINVDKLFEYLKLQYDTSRSTYTMDIEYLIEKRLNTNLTEIIEPTYYKNKSFLTTLNKPLSDKYTIQHKIAELKKYLTSRYKDSVKIIETSSESIAGKENNYNYLAVVLNEYTQLNAENDYKDYIQLGYGKYNPYESLNKTFKNTIALLWVLYAFIFYFIFHTMYDSYYEDIGSFITIVCLALFIILITLMLLRSSI